MSLTLFENITEEVTVLEKEKLVPLLVDMLANTNTENRYRTKWICDYFKACGYSTTDVRVRKMVSYIRCLRITSPFVLIGTSTGYFLSKDISEVDAEIESMMQRVRKQLAAVDSMKAERDSLLHLKLKAIA